MNQPTSMRPRAPTLRGVASASLFGAATALIAYAVARGNLFWMLIVMIVIGVVVRLHAYRLVRRNGTSRPWWKWL